MSLKDVLKNIFSFVDILQRSRTDAVVSWDSQAIDDAFCWAKYCEQIYNKAKDRSYYAELDRHVQGLVKVPVVFGTEKIGLEMLQKSVNLLSQSLLENQKLHDDQIHQVLRLAGFSNYQGKDRNNMLMQNLAATSVSAYMVATAQALVEDNRLQLDMAVFEHTVDKTWTDLLLQYINSIVHIGLTHR
ncbi:PREDICTED: uncharacterized protein LOC106814250 isoform X2 [Priapulus caudatus]|uniref:Uncharacterized protein LOC106814250 isoform X1 n=1 Tax=Priapulus caudatus TaxID=37621 RepID=A0ABM1EPB2_PRICU|nr:PREDICTED: uncharacterized protein LOC106814250 isoform X1 [Priapulus caudatus]XP_014674033.1 PREDICTED: uncharacterized protein LOC106814250 isoform X2 [Priapulus caudatus]